MPKEIQTFWLNDTVDRTMGYLDREQERYLINDKKVFYQTLEASNDTKFITLEFRVIGHGVEGPKYGVVLLQPIAEHEVKMTMGKDMKIKLETKSTVPKDRWVLSYSVLCDSTALIECDPCEGKEDVSVAELLSEELKILAKIRKRFPDPSKKLGASADAFTNLATLRKTAKTHKEFKKGDEAKTIALAKSILDEFEKTFDELYKTSVNKNGLTVSRQAWSIAYPTGMLKAGYNPTLSTISFTQAAIVTEPGKSIPKELGEEGDAIYWWDESDDTLEEFKTYLKDMEELRQPYETSLHDIITAKDEPVSLTTFAKSEKEDGE